MSKSSLIKWLATFQLDGRASIEPDNDACYHLADGFVCARILNQICPRYFTDKWLDGIKPVPPNGSWRLRVSNLKRILQKVHDYASDLQSPQFKPDSIIPDVAVIAQNFDVDQIGKLIQLILFCAINCEKKQAHIETIGNLPTQIKRDIKEAIEELLVRDTGNQHSTDGRDDSVQKENGHNLTSPSKDSSSVLSTARVAAPYRTQPRSDSNHSNPGDVSRRSEFDLSGHETIDESDGLDLMKRRLNDALIAKEEKAQACHELEIKLRQLQMEKEQLMFENEKFAKDQSQARKTEDKMRDFRFVSQNSRDIAEIISSDREARIGSGDLTDNTVQNSILQQNIKLQSEINRLKGDLIRLETEKEEYRLKSNLLKEDRDTITRKHDELRDKAEQAKRLQDELDEQRHISEKVTTYEAMVGNLVKKNNEMKRDLKESMEKNTERIQRIISLEEENKQLESEINRIDIYKKQLQDVQVKLSEETYRADKAEVELVGIREKFDAIKRENEKLHDVSSHFIRGSHSTPVRGELPPDSSTVIATRSDKQYSPVNLKDGMQSLDLAGGKRYAFDEDDNEKCDYRAITKQVAELRDNVDRLECENQLLQSKLRVRGENDQSVLEGLLDSANDRCIRLEMESRNSKKKITILEGRLKDLLSNTINATSSSVLRDISGSDCNTEKLFAKIEELQKLLFQREQEIMDSENKYKRNLQKARDVIKSLNNNQSLSNSMHPSNVSLTSLNMSSLDETNVLRQKLKERENRLMELEREFYEFRKFKEIHERLIISAFYGLTTPMQWRNAEKRLERTTLTSPPNTASSSINNPKHSH